MSGKRKVPPPAAVKPPISARLPLRLGEIDVSYSDDMGAHWVKGNGGKALDSTNNQTSLTLGHVEDKEWIAVNHIFGNVNQDHVYAMWTTFNGASGGSKIMVAVSRDRGQTFSKAV